MNPAMLALMIPLVALGLGAMGIWTTHLERMAKLRIKSAEAGDARAADEIKRLREELETLRQASTNFDLSFDERLDRLEARTSGLELRVAGRTGADGAETRSVGVGG